MELFGSSGTRGLATGELGPEFVARVAGAAVTVYGADEMALARDTRTTGALLADAAAAGIAGAGADVADLGVVPTPAAQAYAERAGVPSVVVTASHNPPAYNGVKLVGADGVGADVPTYEAVEGRVRGDGPERAAYDAVGTRRSVPDAAGEYVDAVVEAVPAERIAAAELTVALDPGHGAGCATSPDLLAALGCAVRTVHAQPDGHFPGRDPEPVPEHLGDLRRLVRASDADLGIAHDGDADRAVFVDETGETIPADSSLAALAADALGPDDTMVSAVNVSRRVADAVEAAGARLELTPIGSTHIVTRVRELAAAGERVPVAGEGNGGVAFPPFRLARDGGYAAARFLALVAERPASVIAAEHAGYHAERRTVEHGGDPERAVGAVAEAATGAAAEGADAPTLTTTDGYRLDYDDAWVLARPSGTEPVLRVRGEARDPARAAELVDWLADAAREAVRGSSTVG